MDKDILDYINTYFTHELKSQIIRLFELLSKFGVTGYDTDFINIISNSSFASTDDVYSEFISEINKKQDYILKSHFLIIRDDATILQKNEIISALYNIQDLEDYSYVSNCLESLEDDLIIISKILSENCGLSNIVIMDLIVEFNPLVLNSLKNYIYSLEEVSDEIKIDTDYSKIIKNFQCLYEVYGSDSVGYELYINGMKLGLDINIYMPFVKDDLLVVSDIKQTSINLLSVIYLTQESLINPIQVYRKISFEILQDTNLIQLVEKNIYEMSNSISMKIKQNKLLS